MLKKSAGLSLFVLTALSINLSAVSYSKADDQLADISQLSKDLTSLDTELAQYSESKSKLGEQTSVQAKAIGEMLELTRNKDGSVNYDFLTENKLGVWPAAKAAFFKVVSDVNWKYLRERHRDDLQLIADSLLDKPSGDMSAAEQSAGTKARKMLDYVLDEKKDNKVEYIAHSSDETLIEFSTRVLAQANQANEVKDSIQACRETVVTLAEKLKALDEKNEEYSTKSVESTKAFNDHFSLKKNNSDKIEKIKADSSIPAANKTLKIIELEKETKLALEAATDLLRLRDEAESEVIFLTKEVTELQSKNTKCLTQDVAGLVGEVRKSVSEDKIDADNSGRFVEDFNKLTAPVTAEVAK